MKATTLKKILISICEDCQKVNKARNEKGITRISYQLSIRTGNREYRYNIDDESDWSVEDGYLWLSDESGTRWIDTDKIESIEL